MTDSITVSFKRSPTQTKDSSSYRFPKGKLYDDFTDYVRFDFYKYTAPFTTSGGAIADGNGDVKFNDKVDSLNLYNSSVEGNNLLPATDLKTILLYMPEDISTGTQIEWAGKGFTNSATDILKLAGPISAGNPGAALDNLKNMLGKIAQRGPSLAAQGIVEAINKLPGGIGGDVGIQDVLGGIGGVILNPNTELMFGGFALRSFDLNFKMSPRDSAEAKEIRAICNTFKRASLPSYSTAPSDLWTKTVKWLSPNSKEGEDQNSNYLGIPNLVNVTFMSGTGPNKYVSQFKTCAITKVDINYTPDGSYATYGGSTENSADTKSPVATELSIGFTETKLVFRQEIDINGPTY
jgi:hypothetical protein